MNKKGVIETLLLAFLFGDIFGFTVAKATDKDCPQTMIVAEANQDEPAKD